MNRGKRTLRRWTRVVTGHALLIVLAASAAIAVLAGYTVSHLGISTNTENMIAEDIAWRQDFIEFRTKFPQLYRNVVVVVTADTEATAQSATRHLARLLEDMPEHVTSVYAPTIDKPLAGNELLFLETDRLEDLVDNLAGAQAFIGRLRAEFSLASLFELLETAASRRQLGAGDRILEDIDRVIAGTLAGNQPLFDWSAAAAGTNRTARRLVFVKPVLDPTRPRAGRPALTALAEAGDMTADAFGARARIQLTGLVALEDEELVNVTRNAQTTGLLALGSVMLVLLFAFRSLRLLLVSVITLLAGLTATAAFAAWSVESLNIISVAFAVLYIGLGIDFVIHYLLRLRETSARGATLEESLEIASEEVGGSLFICAVTTAAGFYAFIPTSFTGVSQLGLVSGTGMFISFVTTLTLLPALIRLCFPAGLHVADTAASWGPGRQLSKLLVYRRTIIAIPVVLAIATLINVDRIRFESDPMLLRDPAMPSVQTYRELSDDPDTTPTAISVLTAPDQDLAARTRALERLPSVERAVSLQSFETRDRDEQVAVLDDLLLLLGPDFEDFPQLAPIDLVATRTAIAELDAALTDEAGDGSVPMQDLGATLTELDKALENRTRDEQRELLGRLQRALLSDLPAAMQLLADRLQPELLSAADFPPAFVERWRAADGTRLIQVAPARDVSDPDNAAAFVTQVLGAAPRATGLPVVYHKSGNTVIGAFAQAFVSAFVTIAVLLLVLFRSGRDMALILTPLGFSALLLTGFMIVIDLPFNFANIIALPLLLGIGVDTGIHLVHRAREIEGRGIRLLETSTSRAILFSTVTTLASFGNLGLSTHLGMASMGILLAAGLVVILIMMILILPVLINMDRRCKHS